MKAKGKFLFVLFLLVWTFESQSSIQVKNIRYFSQPALQTLNPPSDGSSQIPVMVNLIDVPIAGYSPQVILGMTDSTINQEEWDAVGQPVVTGNLLPSNANPYYTVVILDTGANVMLLGLEDRQGFGISSTGSTITLEGAGPEVVIADILSAGGFFAGGLSCLTNHPTQPDTSMLRGASNVEAAGARQDDLDLPTVSGLPLDIFYTTVIRPDRTYYGEFNGILYQSPKVEFYTSRYDPNIPPIDYFVPIIFTSQELLALPPTFIPSGLEDIGLAPYPTLCSAMLVTTNITHAGRQGTGNFLFDTGAQISVISRYNSFILGLDLNNPLFEVEITGVGGTVANAPGFVIDKIELPAQGVGNFVLLNVPVVVHDVKDGSGGILGGIVGMNLFTDRNLVIHSGYDENWNNGFIGISGAIHVPKEGDVTDDGAVEAMDVQIIQSNWGKGPGMERLQGDLSGDGFVDAMDLHLVTENLETVALPGDVNGDNSVNASDLSILSDNWGKSDMLRTQGDLSGDGIVGERDKEILIKNWGR